MKDIPILLIMLAVYLIAFSGGRKKAKKQKPARAASRSRAREERARMRTEQTEQGFSTAFGRDQSVQIPEGVDLCHPAPEQSRIAEDEPALEQSEEPQMSMLQQDVLRGVIMSEILTRPCERRRNGMLPAAAAMRRSSACSDAPEGEASQKE